MKTYIYLLFSILFFSACQKEQLVGQNIIESTNMPVFEAFIDNVNSRAKLENDLTVTWEKDDRISIFTKSQINNAYILDDKDGGQGKTQGKFVPASNVEPIRNSMGRSLNPVSASSNLYGAVYPYKMTNAVQSLENGLRFSIDIPSVQTYKLGTFDPSAFFMVAVSDKTNLNFKNVCGALKIQLWSSDTKKIQSIIINGNNNEVLAGKGTCDLEMAGNSFKQQWISCPDNQEAAITLNCSGTELSKDKDHPTTFLIVLPPIKFNNGFSVRINDTDGKTFTQVASGEKEIVRNHILKMAAIKYTSQTKSQTELETGVFINELIKDNISKVAFRSNTKVKDKTVLVSTSSSTIPAYLIIEGESAFICSEADEFLFNKNCSSMFLNTNLSEINFDNCNTSNVVSMRSMFGGSKKLENLDLSHFDTQNVNDMYEMFRFCFGLKSLDVSSFNTSRVTDMTAMFYGLSLLTTLEVGNFDTSNVRGMWKMFADCSKLQTLDVSHFNTGNVSNMTSMFSQCSELTSLDVSHFNTSKVERMNGMFRKCINLTALDVSSFNTSNVTDMELMFEFCEKLTSLNVRGFDTRLVTNMSSMFQGCSNIQSLDLSSFNTSNVTNMRLMFSSCEKLESLDVSGFDTRLVTDMNYMFHGCSNIHSLDLSSFNTINVTDMSFLFYNCNKLSTLNISNFNAAHTKKMNYMLSGCSNLQLLDLGKKFCLDGKIDLNDMCLNVKCNTVKCTQSAKVGLNKPETRLAKDAVTNWVIYNE